MVLLLSDIQELTKLHVYKKNSVTGNDKLKVKCSSCKGAVQKLEPNNTQGFSLTANTMNVARKIVQEVRNDLYWIVCMLSQLQSNPQLSCIGDG